MYNSSNNKGKGKETKMMNVIDWTKAETVDGGTAYYADVEEVRWFIHRMPDETGWWLSEVGGDLRYLAENIEAAKAAAEKYV